MKKISDSTHRPSRKAAAALVFAALVLIVHGFLTFEAGDSRRRSHRRRPPRPSPVVTTRAKAPEVAPVEAVPAGSVDDGEVVAAEPTHAPVETAPPTEADAAPGPEVEPEPPAPLPPLDPVLTRIVYVSGDPDSTFAVVGGRAVRAGDSLDAERTVGEILADRILLSPGGELRPAPDPKGETK